MKLIDINVGENCRINSRITKRRLDLEEQGLIPPPGVEVVVREKEDGKFIYVEFMDKAFFVNQRDLKKNPKTF